MFSVIFEVHPRPERFDDYLALAGRLKPLLERIEGFVDNERFESLMRPGWLLSHSTWRDEKSLVRWRTQGEHHAVQERGRTEIFQDYRIRVGAITADSAPPAGLKLEDQRLDETQAGAARLVTLTELMPRPDAAFADGAESLLAELGLEPGSAGVVEHDLFASIYNRGKLALLLGWNDPATGRGWRPRLPPAAQQLRHRAVRVVREYGLFDRREAPQFHRPVTRE